MAASSSSRSMLRRGAQLPQVFIRHVNEEEQVDIRILPFLPSRIGTEKDHAPKRCAINGQQFFHKIL